MDWQRRRLLQLVGTTGAAALAGCSGDGGDPEADSQPGTDTSSLSDTPDSPDTPQPEQVSKLVPDDGSSYDDFGWSVAVSGDGTTALIGAIYDGNQTGSAYVFEASGGSWTQQAKLAADDGDDEDYFGSSVAVSSDGTTAVIGADGDEDPNGESAGSAYVFEASGGSWTQQAKLTADDGDKNDQFGSSVTVSSDGTTAVIGADGDEDPNGESAGSAYVFEASGKSWAQKAKLAADDGASNDYFGWSVAVSGDGTTALIGAFGDDVANANNAGSTYVFETSGESWTQQAKLTANDGDDGDDFGWSVAVSNDGTTALIGAHYDEDPNGTSAGSAYVFTL